MTSIRVQHLYSVQLSGVISQWTSDERFTCEKKLVMKRKWQIGKTIRQNKLPCKGSNGITNYNAMSQC